MGTLAREYPELAGFTADATLLEIKTMHGLANFEEVRELGRRRIERAREHVQASSHQIALDGHVTIAVAGELDLRRARQLKDAVQRALSGDCERLVVDMRELTLIDSSGVRVLLMTVSRCAEQNCELEFVRSRHDPPWRALELLGIDESLPWREPRAV
jgi:anti-anti-sigma factor